jgi:amidase
MNYADYARHDAVGLADRIRHREVSAGELVDIAFVRMNEVNGYLNAVIFRLEEQARQAAANFQAGLFGGVPFLLKNLDADAAGVPLTMGSRALRNYIAPCDSELVARYRSAGLIFVGTTNSPELGLLPTTEPELHGPTRNPWNFAYSVGGSSGGAAAAVAAGIVPAAHGSDGGGSIRIPASACGLFGLKPTRGRMPLGPDMSDGWNGLVVPHVISRSVRDSAALLDATYGADVGAPYVISPPDRSFMQEVGCHPGKLRVAFTSRSVLGEHTHQDCLEACEDVSKLLVGLGHDVEEVELPLSPEELRLAYLTVISACTAAAIDDIARLLGQSPRSDLFEVSTWFLRQVGLALSASDYEQARKTIGHASRTMGEFFTKHDVVMTPTMAYPPVEIGEFDLKPAERVGLAILRAGAPKFVLRRVLAEMAAKMFEKTANTMLFNMTGQPAMSVPLSWNRQALPIGIQFAGRFGDEATLLRLASQLEQARPWADRRPTAVPASRVRK